MRDDVSHLQLQLSDQNLQLIKEYEQRILVNFEFIQKIFTFLRVEILLRGALTNLMHGTGFNLHSY